MNDLVRVAIRPSSLNAERRVKRGSMAGGYLALLVVASLLQSTHSLTASEKATFDSIGKVSFAENENNYVITSDGIPTHASGPFPSSGNPNTIQEQSHSFTILKTGTADTTPRCLPMGVVGIALNGVPFFNPYTREGYDAVTGEYAEEFDSCDGHPAERGQYHYHQTPDCLEIDQAGTMLQNVTATQLIGVALDGYPIYGPIFPDGTAVTSVDLDKCHGRMEDDGSYRYYTSRDFPYILGCYTGTVVDQSILNSRGDCSFATADDYLGSDSWSMILHSGPSCQVAAAVIWLVVITNIYT